MKLWSFRPLKDFCVEVADRCADRNLPVFSVSKNLGILPQAERFKKRIASADTSRYKVIYPGDFAYDPMLLWSGSISRHTGSVTGIVSPAYCVFRLIKGIIPRFLQLYLTHPDRLLFYESISFGTNERRRKAQFSDFAKLKIPVPPVLEQERIAKLLDQADELLDLRAQADHRTADLIPALFHHMFGDPVHNPLSFPVVHVEEVGKIQLGRQRAPKYQSGKHTRPYVRVANVFEDRIDISDLLSMDFDNRDFDQYKLEYGDILLNEGQSTELVGRPAMWRNEVPDCCFQNTLVRFQADRTKVLPDYALALFLVYFRNGTFARISSKTSNVAHLGAGRLAKMPFPLPTLPLQEKFAARVAEIRAMEIQQAASRRRLDDLFHSMLHRAFQGEL